MIDQPVCLTLIVPHQLRDEMFDFLTEQSDLVSGFTASQGSGHADQTIVQVVLRGKDASRLLDRVRVSFAGTKLVYWTTPVTERGTIE